MLEFCFSLFPICDTFHKSRFALSCDQSILAARTRSQQTRGLTLAIGFEQQLTPQKIRLSVSELIVAIASEVLGATIFAWVIGNLVSVRVSQTKYIGYRLVKDVC